MDDEVKKMSKSEFKAKYGLSETQYNGKNPIYGKDFTLEVPACPKGFRLNFEGRAKIKTMYPDGIPQGMSIRAGLVEFDNYNTNVGDGAVIESGMGIGFERLGLIGSDCTFICSGQIDMHSIRTGFTKMGNRMTIVAGGDVFLRIYDFEGIDSITIISAKRVFVYAAHKDIDAARAFANSSGVRIVAGDGVVVKGDITMRVGDFEAEAVGRKFIRLDGVLLNITGEREIKINGDAYRLLTVNKIADNTKFYVLKKGNVYSYGETIDDCITAMRNIVDNKPANTHGAENEIGKSG